MSHVHVLVLGGGPDAEREVSLESARCVAEGLAGMPGVRVTSRTIDRVDIDQLRAMPGEVVFPVLHGGFGEGGPLQDLLELDGRPFVGSKAPAARLAMDKLATKLVASELGIPTPRARALNTRDEGCPLEFPVVVKPVHEGSSVGVHFCADAGEYARAVRSAAGDVRAHPGRVYFVEGAVVGARELTVGWLDGEALPVIEIKPSVAFYDYQAKYQRDDTRYVVRPELPAGVRLEIQDGTGRLARAMGVRHLCRADFLLDAQGRAWLLEVNTMPGCTSHSLLPMAAGDAAEGPGLSMGSLAKRLVEMAQRDHAEGEGRRSR